MMISLPALLGTNLWLVTLMVPYLLAEGAPLWVSATLPLGPILLVSYTRHPRNPATPPALLCGVPLFCLVPAAHGSLAEVARLPRQAVVVQAAALLAYLAATCKSLGTIRVGTSSSDFQETAPLQAAEVPRRWRRRVFLYRALFVLSLVAPTLLLYAIHQHPVNLRALRLSFGQQSGLMSRIAAVQAAATAGAALVWVALYKLCFLRPLSGHLLHDRDINLRTAALQTDARRGRPRAQFYLAMLLALGSMILLIFRSLRST